MAEVVVPALIGGAVNAAVNSILNPPPPQPQLPPVPEIPVLSREEALQLAQSMLNPLFDEQLQETLRRVDLENIRRGFFGQAPGAALSGARAADVERARAAAIANLVEQMVGQSQQAALQAAALAQQSALQQYQLAQQQWQNLSSNIMRGIQTGLLGAQMWSDWTGLVPFSGGQFTLGSRQALSNIGVPQVLSSPPTSRPFQLNRAISRSDINWINPY